MQAQQCVPIGSLKVATRLCRGVPSLTTRTLICLFQNAEGFVSLGAEFPPFAARSFHSDYPEKSVLLTFHGMEYMGRHREGLRLGWDFFISLRSIGCYRRLGKLLEIQQHGW